MNTLLLPSGCRMVPKLIFVLIIVFITLVCLMESQVVVEGFDEMGCSAYLLTILAIGYGLGVPGIVQAG